MEDFSNKVTQPMQHYFDVIERLLEELYYIENVLDILNIGFARQSAQEWAESTTHILTGYIRQVRVEYETEFKSDDVDYDQRKIAKLPISKVESENKKQ